MGFPHVVHAVYLDRPPRKSSNYIGGMIRRAHKDKIRDDYLKLAQSGDSNLFMPGDVRKVSGYGDLALQMDDGLVNTSDPDSPSLRLRRHEKMAPGAVPSEESATHSGNQYEQERRRDEQNHVRTPWSVAREVTYLQIPIAYKHDEEYACRRESRKHIVRTSTAKKKEHRDRVLTISHRFEYHPHKLGCTKAHHGGDGCRAEGGGRWWLDSTRVAVV